MTLCALTELEASGCAHCRPPAVPLVTVLPPVAPPRRRVPSRPPREPGRYRLPDGARAAGPQRARSRGQCADCGQPYARGALIRPHETTGGWIAECCFTTNPSSPKGTS